MPANVTTDNISYDSTAQGSTVKALVLVRRDEPTVIAPVESNTGYAIAGSVGGAMCVTTCVMFMLLRRRWRELLSDPLAYAKRRVWAGT